MNSSRKVISNKAPQPQGCTCFSILPNTKTFPSATQFTLDEPPDMTEAAKAAAKFLKSTLRLPSSKFPPRPIPADLPKYLPRCTDDLYSWQSQSRPVENTFTLHDGPPYANGDLHVGHALNKIVKDIICRTKLAEGRRIDYVPGWDCHGLPIELKALEKNGWKRGQGVDAVAIRKAARKFAYDTVKKQMKGFKSWGVMGDWNGHWKTMDKDFELRQLDIFRAMSQSGLIYRRYKPVYWSPSSGTALAEAEVDYKNDYVSTAALVKFPLDNSDAHMVIWTTTPWTIPANQAVAISKSIEYSMVESKHGKLIVATSRIPFLEEQIGSVKVMKTVTVEELLNSTYSGLELFGEDAQNRPIIHADFVKDDSGTGVVHCAPGHGKEDFEALQPLIQSGRVSVKAPVDDQGKYTLTGSLAGLYVYGEGNQQILDILRQNDRLLSSYKFKHKYPIDWRTKEPVMIRATAQWFADVSSIKDATLSSLDSVSFKPDTGSTRLRSFVGTRSEWCISRQRAWGVPIPALYHKETGEALVTTESIDQIIATIKERGIDSWWSDPIDDPAWVPSSDYIRGTDTMDVWFDSGSSWTFMGDKQADVYLEGSDQHRGWFQSSLLTSIAYQTSTGKPVRAPFKTLVTHGFTLDANEKKMSKSEGNVIAPDDIIAGLGPPKNSKRPMNSHGPDSLRLWAASNDWTTDVKVSETTVSNVHTNLDKYRVTIKLLLGMLQDFKPRLIAYEDMSQVDQIAMLQLYKTTNLVKSVFTEFEFYKAITAINKWIASDLSGFYFEAVKDIIYCDSPSSLRRLSAQTALYHIFHQLQHMLGPITPLLIEESIEYSPESIRTMSEHPLRRIWNEPPTEWNNEKLQNQLPYVMAINSSVKVAQERARAARLLGQSLASEVLIWLNPNIESIPTLSLKEILVVSDVSYLEGDFDLKDDSTCQKLTDSYKSSNSWSQLQEIEHDGKKIGFVIVRGPSMEKCSRCWKYEAPQEESLCTRCTEVVTEFKQVEG